MSINLTTQSHAPSGANGQTVGSTDTAPTITVNENGAVGTSHQFGVGEFGFNDPGEGTNPDTFTNVRITTKPTGGKLFFNNVEVAAGQFIPVNGTISIASVALLYFPNPFATGSDSFTFQVQDDGKLDNGGKNLDEFPDTMPITINAASQPPVGQDNAVSVKTGGTFAFGASLFPFTDPHDPGQGNAFAGIVIPSGVAGALPASGSLNLARLGRAIQHQRPADLDQPDRAQRRCLTYVAPASATTASFKFEIQDNGTVANGGVSVATAANTMTLNVFVQGTDHAPVGTSKTATPLQGQPYQIQVSDFGFTDPSDTTANNPYNVFIDSVSGGQLFVNGQLQSAPFTIRTDAIANNKLTYQPPAGYGILGSLKFRVQDDGIIVGGATGADTDTVARTLTFNVTRVHSAPAGIDHAVTTPQPTGSNYTFTLADFPFSDNGDNPADGLAAVEITSLPVDATQSPSGSLKLNGTPVTATQFVSVQDIAAGNLKFTPDAGNVNDVTFKFQVQDNGDTSNGGANFDLSANTETVHVSTAINTPPTGQDKTVTTAEDKPYQFVVGDFPVASDTTPDNIGTVVITQLPAGGGKLKLGATDVILNQEISVNDIAAGNFTYVPALHAFGATIDSFKFKLRDGGGAPGDLEAGAGHTLSVTVTQVHHTPSGANNSKYHARRHRHRVRYHRLGLHRHR